MSDPCLGEGWVRLEEGWETGAGREGGGRREGEADREEDGGGESRGWEDWEGWGGERSSRGVEVGMEARGHG